MCHTNTVHIDTATAELLLVAGDKNKQKSILKASSNSTPCYIFTVSWTKHTTLESTLAVGQNYQHWLISASEMRSIVHLHWKTRTPSICVFFLYFFCSSPLSFLLACSLDKTFLTFLKQDTRFLKETDAVVRTDIEENKASNSTSSP